MNSILSFFKSLRQFGWIAGLSLIVILLATFLLTACSQKPAVEFSASEINWLHAHGLYEGAINSSDEAKLKIKEILKVEMDLVNELDTLVQKMNARYADSTGIRLEFSHSFQ